MARAARPPRRPRRARERSPLGALSFGFVFIVLGAMWLIDSSTGVGFRLVQYFAMALLILGLGIGVGAWIGRARWLTLPALLLVPLTVVSSAITLPLEGGYGSQRIVPHSFAEIEPEYRRAIGSLSLSLYALPRRGPEEPVEIEATVTVGGIQVFIPRGMPVDVRARADLGGVNFRAGDGDPFDVDVTHRFGPTDVPPVLILDLRTSLGGIDVWEVDVRSRGSRA